MAVLDGVYAHVVVVGANSPNESANDLRAPRVIDVVVHLGKEPLELGLIDHLDAGEHGRRGGCGGGHVCLDYDEDISEGVEARGLKGFEGVLDLYKSKGDFPCDIENRLNTILSVLVFGLDAKLHLVF